VALLIPAGVLVVVFMTPRAVGLVGVDMSPVCELVQLVLRVSPVGEVGQPVVGWVAVEMADLASRGAWSYECFKNQAMDEPHVAARIAGFTEQDHPMPL
jgi:hypothetical protein